MFSLNETHHQAKGRRLWLGVLVLAWGIQAIVTQSLLLREALVLMYGSEIAWGIVLFAWLLGVAIGGMIGGWMASAMNERRVPFALVIVLMTLSLAACLELWVFRGARAWLGVGPGELLPLTKSALAAILFVSPVGALVGIAFPMACCIVVDGEDPDSRTVIRGFLSLGNVYALESAGSLIGGAAFSFWAVEHLTPIETALVCSAITAVASGGLLAVTARKPYIAVCLTAIGIVALCLSIFAGDELNRRLVHRRWSNIAPGYELCDQTESKYQNLAVGRRAGQFTLYCDGHVSADFPDPWTFVPQAHFWMCQHPSPKQVLVLGGGAEGLLAEILRYPIKHIDYVEPDPRQIELIEPYLADVDRQALQDKRVTVHHVDARYYVKTQRARFDLVIARLPEPTSALRARFYTDEFYRELRLAMTPRAVLCLTAAATPSNLTAASAEYLASIRGTLGRHFPHVTIGWGDPAQVLAATDAGLLSTDPGELADRYQRHGVQSELFHPVWFDGATDWLDPDKLRQRAGELDAIDQIEISTDLRPAVYVQRLVLWERMTGSGSQVIEWLRSVKWTELVASLALAGGLAFFFGYFRDRLHRSQGPAALFPWASRGAIVLSIATTGFATMALSIIWLFAFQNLYGYVYQRIGWIIAVFMGGLVIGCGIMSAVSQPLARSGLHILWRRLIVVDLLLGMLALFVPFLLPLLGTLQSTRLALILVEVAVSLMVALTGVLGGAAFALASSLQLASTGRAGSAAGIIVGADHAGACAGALLTGILLVPVFGTPAAAYLLVGMKLISAVLLLLAWKVSRAAQTS